MGGESPRVLARALGQAHTDLSLAIPFENWFGEAPCCICERLISSHVSPLREEVEPFPPKPCRFMPFFNAFPRQNKNA